MSILDPTRDATGAAFHRADTLYTAPGYVKAAAADQLAGRADLPAHAFAEPATRQFPMHTPAATWFSAALLHDQRDQFPPEQFARLNRSLGKAAAYWGIDGDVGRAAAKAAALRQDDLASRPDDDFALVAADDGRKLREYPLRNPVEVKIAAAWLLEHRDRFPLGDRRLIAGRVLDKAAATGVDLGADAVPLERAAGRGLCRPKDAALLLRSRAILIKKSDAEVAAGLEEHACRLEASGPPVLPPLEAIKLAHLIDAVDTAHNLRRLYGHDLERADDVLAAVTVKDASAYPGRLVRASDGAVYDTEALARLKVARLRAVGGDTLAAWFSDDGLLLDLEKAAAALPTLDRDELDAFRHVCREAGIEPVAHEEPDRPRLDFAALGAALVD
jgi:hypothetical protein